MGSNSASGGGNTGPDEGFFISQDKKKSKLSKKNQDLVDASFDERGGVKIDQQFKTPTVAILSGPLKAGSKVTRNFFTDKVLGSKNYKGTSKEDFLNMSISQQESIYGDYIKGRQTGQTDAYGNPIRSRDNGGGNQVVQAPTEATMAAPTTAEVSQSSATDATDATTVDIDDPTYIKRKNKRKGRSLTILTSSKGVSDGLTLGKRSLLGS